MDYDRDRFRGETRYGEPTGRRFDYDSEYHIRRDRYGLLYGYDEGAGPWDYESTYNYDVNRYGQITGYGTSPERAREREIARFAAAAPYIFAEAGAWNAPGPFAGVGPRGYQRSEESICEEVCERLTRHGRIDATDISVSVDDGEVTLEGTVENRRAKRMAEDIAESVRGVRDIHNRLRIEQHERQGQR